jgi:hypothetical protein
MKKFTHKTRAVATAETTPAMAHRIRAKSGIRYYDGITYDMGGNPHMGTEIEQNKVKISRTTTELSGAFPYVFNFIEYMCTHYPEFIDLEDTQSYFYMITAPWDKFIEITLGQYTDQKKLLYDELYRLIHENRPKIVPYDDNTSIFSQPVRIALRSVERAKLSENVLAKLDNIHQEPIGEIQIEFMKPLFRDTVAKQGRFINMPRTFYAKLVDAARKHNMTSKLQDDDDNQSIIPLSEGKESQYHYVSTYMRLWNYLNLHDNGRGNYITVSLTDMLLHIAPQYIQIRNDKVYLDDKKAALNLIATGIAVLQELKSVGTDFSVINTEPDEQDGAIKINIKRNYIKKVQKSTR